MCDVLAVSRYVQERYSSVRTVKKIVIGYLVKFHLVGQHWHASKFGISGNNVGIVRHIATVCRFTIGRPRAYPGPVSNYIIERETRCKLPGI